MNKDIQVFKRKLTNLSSANPLLWMGRLKANIHMDLRLTESIDGRPAGKILEAVLENQKKIPLCAVHDPRNGDENDLSRKLNRLLRMRKLVLQERGVDDLFLAWPFVLGQWQDGSWVRTPFLFIPADLVPENNQWKLKPDLKRAMINPAFLLAYAHFSGKALDTELFEKELDLETQDAVSYLTRLYELIKESSLEINFNTDLFHQQIEPFLPIRKSEYPAGFRPGVLKLQPHAVLGLFTHSDSLLLPDFEYLEEKGVSLESVFLKDEIQGSSLPVSRPYFLPLPVDGSQDECLRTIRSGQSLVVQGPPGTGKSQLIANLIADSIASGKSVLLVCQKKVALEVVYNRLSQIGIAKHIGLWADFKKDLTGIYQQIAGHIEELEQTEAKNQSLDTVVLERRFTQNNFGTEKLVGMFDQWKSAIFDEEVAGISWHDLHSLPFEAFEGKPEVTLALENFRYSEWIRYVEWLQRHWPVLLASRRPGSVFQRRSNWLTLLGSETTDPQKSILRLVESLVNRKTLFESKGFEWEVSQLRTRLDDWFPIANQVMAVFEAGIPLIAGSSVSVEHWFSLGYIERLEEDHDLMSSVLLRLEKWPQGLPHSPTDIRVWQALEGRFGMHLSETRIRILSLFDKEAGKYLKMKKMVERSQLLLSGFSAILEEAAWFLEKCTQSDFYKELQFHGPGRVESLLKLERLREELSRLKTIRSFYQRSRKEFPKVTLSDLSACYELASWISGLEPHWHSTFVRLDELFPVTEDSGKVLSDPADFLRAFHTQQNDLMKGDQVLADLPLSWTQATLALFSGGTWVQLPINELTDRLNSTWLIYWKAAIEKRHPILQYSPDWFQQDIRKLISSLEERQALSVEMVKLRLEENTHKDIQRNRLQNRVTYRGLYHQVTKKRMRLPMRTLWQSFGQEVLQLIPCWLATPESVSATWPMEAGFDLVVFDEASQSFAEKGIPAAFRGRQLVVIGDDKQLPPNHLFSSRWEEEGDVEDHFSEQDSFLDLAKQFLPQKMLTYHYRSQFPELIDFSNQHFYKGRLHVLPSPTTLRGRPSQLYFTKVNGLWENQRNEPEADVVAENALRFFESGEKETLGIITFNIRQRDLIAEKIEYLAMGAQIPIPESFFVKNIENVQGDERDHIWFSIGYAPNEKGKLVHQFGSLSQEGGENRLNVAVSRARKSVHVFSSVLPGETGIGDGAGTGPKLLKKYLEYVYFNRNEGEKSAFTGQTIQSSLHKGSLDLLFDVVEVSESGEVSVRTTNASRVYQNPSMIDLFGLRPLYLQKLGYRVEFDFSYSQKTN